MQLTLIVFGTSAMLEVLLWWSVFKRVRLGLVYVTLLLLAASMPVYAIETAVLASALLCLLNGYRVFNLIRLVRGRGEQQQRHFASRQASIWLLFGQVFIMASLQFFGHSRLSLVQWLSVISSVQLGGALVITATNIRQARKTLPPPDVPPAADRDVPALSVCVPARNETTDLEACLQSLLTSDYPKLEILVLDDCSQNARTPAIVQAFAHDGVRFLAGKQPPENWLAKNYAYQQLTEAASGDILLFCGVDTRFEPQTIRRLVSALQVKQKVMVSVLPLNTINRPTHILIQSARYCWELCLPRRALNRPPVISSCWLITKQTLKHAGSFKAVKQSISPEAYFAHQAIQADGYSFMRSPKPVGLTSVKTVPELEATAVRIRYPQLHRRVELVAAVSALEAVLLVCPFPMLIAAIVTHTTIFIILSGVTSGLLLLNYLLIMRMAYAGFQLFGLVALPFAALYDLGILHDSMWRYEFRDVTWKDRNVCIPVMQVYEHLPKVR